MLNEYHIIILNRVNIRVLHSIRLFCDKRVREMTEIQHIELKRRATKTRSV